MYDDEISICDEPVHRNRMSPIRRFRALVRFVMANIPWLDDGDVKFGTKLYAMKRTMKSNLALEHKAILSKDPIYRTEEENDEIYKIIGGFKCFRKYPENVKMMLANYSHFCYFGPDRVIVRENHYATAIFFIISGEVNIIEEKHDAFLNETERIITETLIAGDVFGEICLLHDLPRMETIVSATPVEFLILKRDDFDLVLKATVKEEWDFISSVMSDFDYFKDWDRIRIGECCMQSLIRHYKKGDTILGDGYGRKNYVHFVVDGSCSLVEHIRVKESANILGKSKFVLFDLSTQEGSSSNHIQIGESLLGRTMASQGYLTDKSFNSKVDFDDKVKRKSIRRNFSSSESVSKYAQVFSPINVKNVFMQVCIFTKKACFSLGEPMQNRRVVADEPCVCLLIPAYLLLGRDAIWLMIKQFLTRHIPSTQVVFDQFVKNREWRKYKQKVMTPLFNKFCNNWYANIPYTVRVLNDFDFIPDTSIPLPTKVKYHMVHE